MVLTQSLAIIKYLAEKHGLDGDTVEEKARLLMVHQALKDMAAAFWTHVSSPNYAEAKATYLKQLPLHLEQLSNFLGTRDFLLGSAVKYADFVRFYNTSPPDTSPTTHQPRTLEPRTLHPRTNHPRTYHPRTHHPRTL